MSTFDICGLQRFSQRPFVLWGSPVNAGAARAARAAGLLSAPGPPAQALGHGPRATGAPGVDRGHPKVRLASVRTAVTHKS